MIRVAFIFPTIVCGQLSFSVSRHWKIFCIIRKRESFSFVKERVSKLVFPISTLVNSSEKSI